MASCTNESSSKAASELWIVDIADLSHLRQQGDAEAVAGTGGVHSRRNDAQRRQLETVVMDRRRAVGDDQDEAFRIGDLLCGFLGMSAVPVELLLSHLDQQ